MVGGCFVLASLHSLSKEDAVKMRGPKLSVAHVQEYNKEESRRHTK